MKANNLLTLAITLTLGVILAGSLMMPVIADAQTDLGDPITKTNTGTNDINYGIVDGVEVVITNGTTVTVDGNTFTRSNDVAYLFCTDNAFGWMSANGCLVFIAGETYAQNTTVVYDSSKSGSISADDGTLTVTIGTTTYTSTYTWLLAPNEEGKYVQVLTLGDANYYLDNSKDVIILGGDYNSGDLDTFYWYFNGESKTQDDKVMTVTFDKSLATGTTDIYSGHPVVTIVDGDDSESFTPYRTFVKEEISGHATKGGAYSILGAIPIIVIVGLVVAATGAIFIKRND